MSYYTDYDEWAGFTRPRRRRNRYTPDMRYAHEFDDWYDEQQLRHATIPIAVDSQERRSEGVAELDDGQGVGGDAGASDTGSD